MRCAWNKGCPQYYLGREYLPKKRRDVAVGIANRDYAKELIKEVENQLKLLYKLKDFYEEERLENSYRKLGELRKKLITAPILPIEDIVKRFEEIEYEGKEFDANVRHEYYTARGERVRSKSEKIIADELFRYKIPYKYELPIELEGWDRRITVYPDFTAINCRSGRKWIIEHLGMMDNPSYYEKAMQKLDTYERNGILLGRDLLLLHESSYQPLNTNALRRYIEEYLM